MDEKEVIIKSYNPYELQYPNRKMVSRYTLDLIKYLRRDGFKVIIDDKYDNRRLEYYVQKGLLDFLKDPLIIYLAGIPTNVFISIFTNWLSEKRKNNNISEEKIIESNLVIETKEGDEIVRYSQKGKEISDDKFIKVLNLIEKNKHAYGVNKNTITPNPKFPYPIFLEHTHKIIGWGQIQFTPKGLEVAPATITDTEIWNKIKTKEYKGFSIAGIVKESRCSICGEDYTICNHIAGIKYDHKKCINKISNIDLCEISLVRDPINPEAIINVVKD